MPSGEFGLRLVHANGRVVVRVRGEVDMSTAPHVVETVAVVVAGGCRDIVIDLRAVSFMDSSGVHMLEAVSDLCPEGVRCTMLDDVPPVSRVLAISGRSDVLPQLDPTEL